MVFFSSCFHSLFLLFQFNPNKLISLMTSIVQFECCRRCFCWFCRNEMNYRCSWANDMSGNYLNLHYGWAKEYKEQNKLNLVELNSTFWMTFWSFDSVKLLLSIEIHIYFSLFFCFLLKYGLKMFIQKSHLWWFSNNDMVD